MKVNKTEIPEGSEPGLPPPRPHGRAARHGPSSGLLAAAVAVRHFLASELQARETRVTKIVAADAPDTGWEAEAEILVPDLAIKTLGLPLTQEVLERRRYAVQLDQEFAVRGYELLDDDG